VTNKTMACGERRVGEGLKEKGEQGRRGGGKRDLYPGSPDERENLFWLSTIHKRGFKKDQSREKSMKEGYKGTGEGAGRKQKANRRKEFESLIPHKVLEKRNDLKV